MIRTSHSETLHNQDYAGELQGYLICISPGIWVDEVRCMWAEYDAAQRGDRSFAYVELLLDDGRTQHEQRGEASQDDVHQMRSIDR